MWILVSACSAPAPTRPTADASRPLPSGFDEAVRFRSTFGLRADKPWVLAAFNDPTATSTEFGVPLFSSEVRDLEGRAANADAVLPLVRAYGMGYPDRFAGMYIDQQDAGIVVVLFTGSVAEHEARIRARVHPAARFVVRPARYSLAELEALNERILADREWFLAEGIALGAMEIDVPGNRISIVLSTTDATAVQRVHAHFASGSMLGIAVDPQPLTRLPRGALAGRVVDEAGNPLAGMDILAIGDIGMYEPDEGVGYTTDTDGMFQIPRLAAMGWEISVVDTRPGTGRSVIGTAHVNVVAGVTTVVEITARP
jgi:hypothetical protein